MDTIFYDLKIKRTKKPIEVFQRMKKYIDKTMRIPMIDGIRCLNLSNAVSILAYEVLRHTNFEHLKETSERLLGN